MRRICRVFYRVAQQQHIAEKRRKLRMTLALILSLRFIDRLIEDE
jgi:hypothetical protein